MFSFVGAQEDFMKTEIWKLISLKTINAPVSLGKKIPIPRDMFITVLNHCAALLDMLF